MYAMIRAYVFLFACDFDGGRIWVARATNECAALQIQIRSAKRRPSRNWFGGRRRSCFVLCFGRAYRILRPTPNNGLPSHCYWSHYRANIRHSSCKTPTPQDFVIGAVVIVGRGSLSMALQPVIDRLDDDAPIFRGDSGTP